MGISLPEGDAPNIPDVPLKIKASNPDTYDYLQRLRTALANFTRGQFNNTFTVSTAINSGTSGTFIVASGGHIQVTSGIVISVTTT